MQICSSTIGVNEMHITERDREQLIRQGRDYRAAKLRRDHEIELLLDAGIELAEALKIASPIPQP